MNDGDPARPGFGIWARGQGHGGPRTTAMLVWLGFIVFPLVDALGHHEPLVRRLLSIAGAAVFVGAYVALVLSWRTRRTTPIPTVFFGVLIAVATALTLADRSSWGFLFTYCAACTPCSPSRSGSPGSRSP
jgi:hypothetical protein